MPSLLMTTRDDIFTAALKLDADDRETFRDGLLAFLPELVDEGRFDEAYVLDVCAERALDPEAEACAFLEDVVLRSLS